MATSREIKIKKLKNKIKETRIIENLPADDHSKRKPTGDTMYEQLVVPNFDLIEAWIRDGLNVTQIARKLGIGRKTLEEYIRDNEELRELFRRTRERLDYVYMINAYQRRAEGYTTIEEEKEYKILDDGTKKLVKIKERERHVPADPRALENWIQLRMNADPMWGKLREVLHNNDVIEAGEGGLVFLPAKKTLEKKDEDGEGNNMDAPTETT